MNLIETQEMILTRYDVISWDVPDKDPPPGIELFIESIGRRTIRQAIEKRVTNCLKESARYRRERLHEVLLYFFFLYEVAQEQKRQRPQLPLF